jgi:uncharacterized protein (TIGR02246 family)
MTAEQIDETMTKYMNAFNACDLDRVMAFFSDDAVYEPGDGKTHRGKAAIRAAFEPQFHLTLGGMRFDEYDRLIDAQGGKVAIRWMCWHDLTQFRSQGTGSRLRKMAISALYGNTFYWHGIDVFHLSADGLITEKYTYGWYGARPYLERAMQRHKAPADMLRPGDAPPNPA